MHSARRTCGAATHRWGCRGGRYGRTPGASEAHGPSRAAQAVQFSRGAPRETAPGATENSCIPALNRPARRHPTPAAARSCCHPLYWSASVGAAKKLERRRPGALPGHLAPAFPSRSAPCNPIRGSAYERTAPRAQNSVWCLRLAVQPGWRAETGACAEERRRREWLPPTFQTQLCAQQGQAGLPTAGRGARRAPGGAGEAPSRRMPSSSEPRSILEARPCAPRRHLAASGLQAIIQRVCRRAKQPAKRRRDPPRA